MLEKKGKRFRAYWGDGYAKKGEKVVGLDFFNRAGGYSSTHIDEVNRLGVGQVLVIGGCPDKRIRRGVRSKESYQEYHTIKRIR